MSQPKALFLADVIKADPASKTHHDEAAAELRRLHGLDFALRDCELALQKMATKYMDAVDQRDALLAALKAAVVRAELRREGAVDVEVICAAITKAEGEKA
jgi:hypothetical protein